MLNPSKEVGEFIEEVKTYCKKTGVRVAWEMGGSHIKVRDGETLKSITDRDGVPLTVPTSPSDWRWVYNARAEFRRAGLLPRSERREQPKMKRGAILSLSERVGRALRPDLAPTTRRALLRDIAELARLAQTERAA